jgi:hypothetical protein
LSSPDLYHNDKWTQTKPYHSTSSNAVLTCHDRCHIWRSFSITQPLSNVLRFNTNRWKILEEDKTRKQENQRSAAQQRGNYLPTALTWHAPLLLSIALVAGVLHRSQHEHCLSHQMKTNLSSKPMMTSLWRAQNVVTCWIRG